MNKDLYSKVLIKFQNDCLWVCCRFVYLVYTKPTKPISDTRFNLLKFYVSSVSFCLLQLRFGVSKTIQ